MASLEWFMDVYGCLWAILPKWAIFVGGLLKYLPDFCTLLMAGWRRALIHALPTNWAKTVHIMLVNTTTARCFQYCSIGKPLEHIYHIYPMFVEGQSHLKWIWRMATMTWSIHPVPQPQMNSSKLVCVLSQCRKNQGVFQLRGPGLSWTFPRFSEVLWCRIPRRFPGALSRGNRTSDVRETLGRARFGQGTLLELVAPSVLQPIEFDGTSWQYLTVIATFKCCLFIYPVSPVYMKCCGSKGVLNQGWGS